MLFATLDDMAQVIQRDRLDTFKAEYSKRLLERCQKTPTDYFWYKTPDDVAIVVSRMVASIELHGFGGVHIEGAIKDTIKKLTGKSTKTAGNAYLAGEI